MIKFFRHIRRSLIQKNQMGKYFKYAIGEILLVVIGILIALQINNWNEGRKAKEKEREVLIEIISDLEYTLDNCDYVINRRSNNLIRTIQSQKAILKVLNTNQPYNDSLGKYFRAANSYDEVDFKTSGYQSLISIGTDLIQDSKLRSQIGKFYTSTINETTEAFDEVKLDFHDYMIDHFRKKFTSAESKSVIKPLHPNDFESLKKDSEYKQSLRTFHEVNEGYLLVLELMKKEMVELKETIQNYMND